MSIGLERTLRQDMTFDDWWNKSGAAETLLMGAEYTARLAWQTASRDGREKGVECATLAEEVHRLRGLVSWTDNTSQKLIAQLEMLEVQAVREITPGWIGIPVVEWDSIMGPNA